MPPDCPVRFPPKAHPGTLCFGLDAATLCSLGQPGRYWYPEVGFLTESLDSEPQCSDRLGLPPHHWCLGESQRQSLAGSFQAAGLS